MFHMTQHSTDTPGGWILHGSDRFFPQTHDITLLSGKNTGVTQKSWFWHTNI